MNHRITQRLANVRKSQASHTSSRGRPWQPTQTTQQAPPHPTQSRPAAPPSPPQHLQCAPLQWTAAQSPHTCRTPARRAPCAQWRAPAWGVVRVSGRGWQGGRGRPGGRRGRQQACLRQPSHSAAPSSCRASPQSHLGRHRHVAEEGLVRGPEGAPGGTRIKRHPCGRSPLLRLKRCKGCRAASQGREGEQEGAAS